MKDGDIDYGNYSVSELRQALESIDRAQYPRNYEKLVETLRGRQPGIPEDSRPIAAAEFRIKFTTTPVVSMPDNSFGLTDKGRLRIVGSTIAFFGRDKGLFRRQRQEMAFGVADVIAVTRNGREFRIDFSSPGTGFSHIAFKAEAADADEVMKLLPVRSGGEARPPVGEIAEFETRLAKISPYTPVTYVLVAINVAIFFAMVAAGAGFMEPDPAVHVRWGSNLAALTITGEWWRLGTSMFLHFGFLHVLVNMWALYANGRLAERLFGSGYFLVLYLLAGLAGSMTSAWWNPAVNSAGASGAIFGMFGGMLAFMLLKNNKVPVAVMTAHRQSIIVFVLYCLIYGSTHAGIDNAAHVGGLVAGFLLGLVLARPIDADQRANAGHRRLVTTSGVASLLLVTAAFGVVRSSEGALADVHFETDVAWFVSQESSVLGEYNEVVELAHAGKLTSADFAKRIESDVLPFYEEAKTRFHAKYADDVTNVTRRDLFAEYSNLRLSALTGASRALRENDLGKMTAAMQMMDQAEGLVVKINESNPANRKPGS